MNLDLMSDALTRARTALVEMERIHALQTGVRKLPTYRTITKMAKNLAHGDVVEVDKGVVFTVSTWSRDGDAVAFGDGTTTIWTAAADARVRVRKPIG